MGIEDDSSHIPYRQVVYPDTRVGLSYGLTSVPTPRAVTGPSATSVYNSYQPPDYTYYGNLDYGFYSASPTLDHTHSASIGRYSGLPTHTPTQSIDQSAYGYDWGARSQSNQYYYPVYASMQSPMSPITPAAVPATMAEKKRDMQVSDSISYSSSTNSKIQVRCHTTTAD